MRRFKTAPVWRARRSPLLHPRYLARAVLKPYSAGTDRNLMNRSSRPSASIYSVPTELAATS